MAATIERNRSFIRRYREEYRQTRQLARLAGQYVSALLRDIGVDLHVVTYRAKGPSSVQEKLRRKSYGNPGRQLTDRIGVRVITYYGRDVDVVVDRLRSNMEVDARNSTDKRHALGVREFGYKSVQLVVMIPDHGLRRLEFSRLRGVRFEIQVRSILEHAWAEIEHEVVYKSSIDYPKEVLRRFAAVAGALEILEREFLSLRCEKLRLVETYREAYLNGKDRRKPFDAARLLGFLESESPAAPSWRNAEERGAPFPTRIEVTCVQALRAAGLDTAESLRRTMKKRGFRRAVRSFGAAQGLEPEQVSHLALILIAVARKSPEIFDEYFPNYTDIPKPARKSKRQPH